MKKKIRWLERIYPYRLWLFIRKITRDSFSERLCYCGHTFKCDCDNPDKQTFIDACKNGSVQWWKLTNGWKTLKN